LGGNQKRPHPLKKLEGQKSPGGAGREQKSRPRGEGKVGVLRLVGI